MDQSTFYMTLLQLGLAMWATFAAWKSSKSANAARDTEIEVNKKIAEAAQLQARHAEALVQTKENELKLQIALQQRIDLKAKIDAVKPLQDDLQEFLGSLYTLSKQANSTMTTATMKNFENAYRDKFEWRVKHTKHFWMIRASHYRISQMHPDDTKLSEIIDHEIKKQEDYLKQLTDRELKYRKKVEAIDDKYGLENQWE